MVQEVELWPQGIIPMKELKEYIAYSRAHCNPQLTDESAKALVEGYLTMRRMGISRKVVLRFHSSLHCLLFRGLATCSPGGVLTRHINCQAIMAALTDRLEGAID